MMMEKPKMPTHIPACPCFRTPEMAEVSDQFMEAITGVLAGTTMEYLLKPENRAEDVTPWAPCDKATPYAIAAILMGLVGQHVTFNRIIPAEEVLSPAGRDKIAQIIREISRMAIERLYTAGAAVQIGEGGVTKIEQVSDGGRSH